MPTRRQTILGLTSAAAGGAVLTTGAFTDSATADADMRVVIVSDLRLLPARDEAASNDDFTHVEEGEFPYVETDDGEVEAIVIEHLNRRALVEFGRIVEVVNDGNVDYDTLTFEFIGDDEAIEVMKIVSEAGVDKDDEGRFTINEDLEPGGDPITFGVTVDLLSDSDRELSNVDLELHITAERE